MAYRKGEAPKVKPDFLKNDLREVDLVMKNMNTFFDDIAKDIRNRQDNVMAIEFTKRIGELLKNNGVVPKITEYRHENAKENSIERIYGVIIDELDFTEHDELLLNEIADMKKRIDEKDRRIAELESNKTVDLPFDPMETANCLINATWERETSSLERGILKSPNFVTNNKYGIDELEQIAEHLLIYCKHNKECE